MYRFSINIPQKRGLKNPTGEYLVSEYMQIVRLIFFSKNGFLRLKKKREQVGVSIEWTLSFSALL